MTDIPTIASGAAPTAPASDPGELGPAATPAKRSGRTRGTQGP
jgi:hypothetical protein